MVRGGDIQRTKKAKKLKEPNTMELSKLHPQKYLKVEYFDGQLPITLRIKGVQEESMGQENEVHPVMYFYGVDAGLVLKPRHTRILKKIFAGAKDTSEWEGKQVTLYLEETSYRGQLFDTLGVMKALPKPAKQSRPPEEKPTERVGANA
jgi:hypothetical protein